MVYKNINLLRIISALAIVYFHFAPNEWISRRWGYIGLVIFVLISITLNCAKTQPIDVAKLAQKRLPTIIYPWIFWSLFYLVFTFIRDGQQVFWGKLHWPMLFGGGYEHLWYLPLIYGAILAMVTLHNRTLNWSLAPLMGMAIGLGFVIFLLNSFIIEQVQIIWPFLQWLSSVPALFLGLAFGRLLSQGMQPQRTLVLGLVGLTIALCMVIFSRFDAADNQMYAIAYGVGFSLFAIAFLLPEMDHPSLPILANLTLGVYLLHPCVYDVCLRLLSPQASPLVLLGLTMVGSFGVAGLLKQVPLIRQYL